MFDFSRFFEMIFKSFDIEGNSKLLEKLESEDRVRFLILIKRHLIYGVLESWRVLVVVLIAVINAVLLTVLNKNSDTISTVIAAFLLASIMYWAYIIINYLVNVYKIHGVHPHIEDIYSAITKTKKSQILFQKIFNHTIFLFILIFLITVFTVWSSIYNSFIIENTDFGVQIINAFLCIAQFFLFASYLPKLMNQEMDFRLVIPGNLVFVNQNGFLSNTQNMKSSKIKTINTDFAGILGSFFNYGDIVILTEGDNANDGKMLLDFTGAPVQTVKEIEKVLSNNLQAIEDEVNILLKKLNHEIGIEDVHSKESLDKLINYVKQNESKLKELYNNSDEETKREIKQLYVLINK